MKGNAVMPEWRTLLLFIFISPAWVMAGTAPVASTPGKMRMRGHIIEAACYVDPRDRSLLVEFNDISARDISGRPEKVSAHGFSIHLLGCSLGDSRHSENVFQRANITFSGMPDRDNPDYLSVQSTTEDLAIEIFDSTGQQIQLGEPSPDYVLNPGKNTLNFTAYLISRDGRMTSGEFTAVTHFVVNYL
jgi:type 1 fimbria pilin